MLFRSGPGYTLLRFDATANVRALVAAAEVRNMPLCVLDVDAANVPPAYQYKLILCRADQHVVWRGDEMAADPAQLVALLCGEVQGAAQ